MAIIHQAPGQVLAQQSAQAFIDTSPKGSIFGSKFNGERNSLDPAKDFTNYFDRVHKKYKYMDTSNIENLVNRLLKEQDSRLMSRVREETFLRDTFKNRLFEAKTPLGQVLQELQNSQESPNRKLLSKVIFRQAENEAGELTKKEVALAIEKVAKNQVSNEIPHLLKRQTTAVTKIGDELVPEPSLCPLLEGIYHSGTTGFFSDVVYENGYAYVTSDDQNNLQIFNVIDKEKPTLVSIYQTDYPVRCVAVHDSFIYMLENDDNFWGENHFLRIIDVRDKVKPILVGSYQMAVGGARDVAVSYPYVYVANYFGLRIIDVSDKENPTYAGSYGSIPGIVSVAVDGDYAYIGKYTGDLQIIDASDKENPTLAGSLTASGINDLAVFHGDDFRYVYMAMDGGGGGNICGLKIINAKYAGIPHLISSIPTESFSGWCPEKVAVSGSGSSVFAVTYDKVLIFDVSDVYNPMFAGSIKIPDVKNNKGIVVYDDNTYVVSGSSSDGARLVISDWNEPCPSLTSSRVTSRRGLTSSCSSGLQWMGFKI
ncbi:MAG: hypothetical protein K1060chlam3_00430 [Candidatus Anoxychlamydiales bacterium]|nr:hypothetical protein [Candidatus Anoxychlamydiales bacterium]